MVDVHNNAETNQEALLARVSPASQMTMATDQFAQVSLQ